MKQSKIVIHTTSGVENDLTQISTLPIFIDMATILTPSTPQNVTVFGDRAFKERIKVKWGHIGGPNPIEEEETQRMFTDRQKTTWGHSEKVAIYKPRRKASGEITPVDTFILNF